ncbi:MAG: DUF4340 domain-containing protein [Planctomycetes bacterium]|nr:DUF4340 domain-containing protein [Planctomycetota bacterium]
MKTKTTYILLIIAILIAGYIFFIDKTISTTDEREAASKKIFGFLKADDISNIEINAPNAAQLTLMNALTPTTPTRIAIICTKTTDKEWLMTQPVNTRADRSVLDNIAGQLAGLEKKDTLKETAKLEPYGLDYPIITISFTTKAKNYLVKLGVATPLNVGVYASIEGDKSIYVVPHSFAELINKPVADFRHKRIFDASTYDMASLRFIRPEATVELQKSGNEWQITQPVADQADQNKVRDILTQLGTLSIAAFVADNETDLTAYGLDKPALRLVVPDPKDPNKSETLLVGREREKDRFVAAKLGTQTIFTIEKSAYDAINLPLETLRNKKVFNLTASDINRIEIKSSQTTVVNMDKNTGDKKWQFVYPAITTTGQAPADVDSFIDKLNNYQIEQFTADTATDLSAFALAEPFAGIEIILGFASMTGENRTLLGVAQGLPYTYLKKPDSPRVVALSNSIYEYLKQGSTLFRRKSLMDVNSDKVKKISISIGKHASTYEQTQPQNWTMIAPEQKTMEQASELNTLMLEFCHMSASEFVADLNFSPDLTAYGLDKPEASVTLVWSDKDKEFSGKTVHIGKKAEDHYYARFADDVIVFKVASSLIEAVRKIIEPPK